MSEETATGQVAGSTNGFGQPVGEQVPWTPKTAREEAPELAGRYVTLRPMTRADTPQLWSALVEASPASLWTYLFSGPFERSAAGRQAFAAYVDSIVANDAMIPFALIVGGKAVGHACLMRDDPTMGVIEVGNIAYGAALQRTTAATEMIYLLASYVFGDLGYRRLEWKCDSLNEPSRRAAARFGFAYEGRFRQAVVYKGRNRDTDWFAMIDRDWPRIEEAYLAWLAPENFDETGVQRTPLAVPLPGA